MGEGLAVAGKTLVVTVGFSLLILGALETLSALTGEGASLKRGLALLAAGLVAAGVPLGLAFRDMLRAARASKRA